MRPATTWALPEFNLLPFASTTGRLSQYLDGVDEDFLHSMPAPGPLEPYSRRVVVDTPQLFIVARRWNAGAKSELHGHSDSTSFYRVITGTVEEERYIPDHGNLRYDVELLAQGDESLLPAGSFHRLRALENTITLHAYFPKSIHQDSAPTNDDQLKMVEARRDFKPRLPRIEFPNWGVKSSGHVKTVEKLARELASHWAEFEWESCGQDNYRVPHRIREDIRNSGILAAPIPRYWGGLTASLTETARALTHIASHAPKAALALVAPLSNAATCKIPLSAIPREHAETLRAHQRWIAEQATRGRILAVADTEPHGYASQVRTVASRDVDGKFYLTGQKSFTTLGLDADYFLCSARAAIDVETPAGTETIIRMEGYFVHRDSLGVALNNHGDAAVTGSSEQVDLNLEYTPAEALFGFPGCFETVNARHWSTLLLSAAVLGIGQALLREGIHQSENSAWSKARLAEHGLTLDAAAGYLESVCEAETWPMSADLLNRVQRVKTFVTQTVVQVATISGGRCYSAQHPVYRFVTDALAGRSPVGNAMDTIIEQHAEL